ncbi:outer membrane receptor protein involved in Fe transport [Tenacibaculum gallaicum]|uniref:Outer membrane receptor protein involved in Fe transport n=1 Tax=Tenacibaculum gallaicum TaxID=561505 RepID=A0A3E0ICJ2_9FLAO|nr:TonB-dependent receptor [Tenacibaculum gallaicum]REH56464.1 outer membrane receptor protein involved in Fe transport [Tenacibaculum gallaicum]
MKTFKNVLLVALFFVTATVLGQTKITGTVVDEMGEPLPGANVVVKGTTNGSATDFDGKFMLNASSNSGVVIVSFVGYTNKEVSFSGGSDLGTIALEPSNVLEEIVVTASGVIDLAEDRKTPVAVSTIKASEIQAKSGAWDLPEVLKSTPSVQSIKAGGFGDGQMFLRGFDQTNTAFLLNGQPINGMEDGKMYWSNWSGVMDVANAIQVQRGLGSSKLAISSVGGTVNIVTKTIDNKEGGYVRQTIGNNAYTKTTAYYSTGVSEKGWSFSGMFGHWQGDGYVDNTHGQGQTYFLSVGYQPNENNTFNFLLTGAPQWHAAAGRGSIQTFLDNGIRYNDWNTNNVNSPNTLGSSKVYPGGRNIYHKPVANLSWDWTINEKSSLSTVLYGSLGRGSFASLITDRNTGEALYARGSFNNHNWYGLVSNYSTKLTDNLDFNVGADVRAYNGIHFRGVNEFIGVSSLDESSVFSGNYTITNSYGGINPWSAVFNPNSDHDQRLGYDYEEDITYYGLFTQLEYSKNAFSAFFQGAVSNQDHVKTDYYNFTEGTDSEKVSNFGYNLKVGAAYEINESHKVFANAGYYSRQPFHDDLFEEIRNSNILITPAVKNQEITGLELGYQFGSEYVSVNLNGYYTKWANRTLLSNNGETFDTPAYESYQTFGVAQLHSGVELEIMTNPLPGLKLDGYVSVGNWEFDGNGNQRTFNSDGNQIGTEQEVVLDGFKVGGAAQTTAGVMASYKILPTLSIDGNWNFYKNLYSTGSLTQATVKLPTYNLTDLGLSFSPKLKEGTYLKGISFRVNVDNVFDELYLESVSGNTQASNNPLENWKGVNTSNNGRFGYGRTWNASVKLSF